MRTSMPLWGVKRPTNRTPARRSPGCGRLRSGSAPPYTIRVRSGGVGADRPSTATPRGSGRTEGGPCHPTLLPRGRGRSRRWRCRGARGQRCEHARRRTDVMGARCPPARWPSAAPVRLRAPDGHRDSRAVGRCGSSGHHPVRAGFRSERHELTRDMLCERARQFERVPLAAAEQALRPNAVGAT